jgi:hypothetical protein
MKMTQKPDTLVKQLEDSDERSTDNINDKIRNAPRPTPAQMNAKSIKFGKKKSGK